MKKYLLAFIPAAAMAVTLAGCSTGTSTADSTTASGGSDATQSVTEITSESGSNKDALAAGYLDDNNHVTAKALVELDGKELSELAESAGYTWTGDQYGKEGANVHPTRALTSEEMKNAMKDLSAFDFSQDEVKAFGKASLDAPVNWSITNFDIPYENVEQVLSTQNVDIEEQCEIENGAYGKEIWAIVKNSNSDRFLLEARYYDSDKSGYIQIFEPEYLKINARGMASTFNDYYEGLEEARTVDDVWKILSNANK